MAQHSVGAAGEHRRPAAPRRSERAVSHGVDAAVAPVQASCRCPPRDRGGAEPEREQLPMRDDAALAFGGRGNGVVDEFVSHTDT